MGRGGEASAYVMDHKPASSRAPSVKPPFTLGDLKRAIPPHCFKRSLLRSSAYLAVDLTVMAGLYYATKFFNHPSIPSWVTHGLLWPLYWICQGSVGTGVWVIAHECGHQAFSDSGVVNDTVGLVLHSALLVPYFSWKYSHRRHHSNTGSLDKDEVFVPKKHGMQAWYEEYLDIPLLRLLSLTFILTCGCISIWLQRKQYKFTYLFAFAVFPLHGLTIGSPFPFHFNSQPLYLSLNSSGRKYEKAANHFYPKSPIFNDREQLFVAFSDVGLLAALGAMSYLGSSFGFVWLLQVYLLPLLVVNACLVLITFLQHTHLDLPHYEATEWEWLKGALATVDRNYGMWNHVFHHIADTHVAHHLFSTMPHYHAEEATCHLKPILGSYYKFDATPVPQALWREYSSCRFVEADSEKTSGVVWFTKL